MSWNIKDLDKNKTEQSIANETIRIEQCHKELDKLIGEVDRLRSNYREKHDTLCEHIDNIKESIELGEQFINKCQEHLKDFEN